MKKVLVLLLTLLVPLSAFGAKSPDVQEFTSIDELAGAIAAFFPKIEGKVTAVNGDMVTLTLTRRDGLTPGMELSLWRSGTAILHPVTGEVIGHREDEVGSIEVVEAGDTSSTAVIKKKVRDPKPGDKARITPKKIDLAIVPLTPGHADIVQGLTDRLTEYGRFSVLDADKVAGFLMEKNRSDSALVKEMGSRFNLDALVSLSIIPTKGKLLVTARLFYTADASLLDTIIARLDLKPAKNDLTEVRPFFMPSTAVQVQEQNVTPELPVDVRLMTVADFDGDGKLEYAFSDGSKLHVFRLEPAGWREVWAETEKPATEVSRQINIDSADVNGNGKPEIFVTAMTGGKVFSYVVEFQDGGYRRIADVPGFLRTLNYPGKGVLLLGQAFDPATFYAGQPHVYTWQNGTYVAGAEWPLPRGAALYGFAVAEFGEAVPLLVALDDDGHLLVYLKDNLVWKSEEEYPVVNTFVYKPVKGVGAVPAKEASESGKGQGVRIGGRVATADMNADGKDEIILPKNISSTFFGGFKAAEMEGRGWTGARLEQQWNIKDIPGPVLDFQVLRGRNNTTRILALVRTKGGLFSKDREQVMTYSVK